MSSLSVMVPPYITLAHHDAAGRGHPRHQQSRKQAVKGAGQVRGRTIPADQAFGDYYLHLLELHERLLPHLNEEQQEKIKKDQKSLQRAINSRF